jgi:hypothetical protein
MTEVNTTRLELPGFGGVLLSPGDGGYDESRAVSTA